MNLRDRIYLDVEAERLRQEQLWGEQHHTPEKWFRILGEEFGEVAKAINELSDLQSKSQALDGSEVQEPPKHDERGLRSEVLECLAVALAWLEDIDAGPMPVRQAV